MKFGEMPYTRPNMDECLANLDSINAALKNAQSAEEQIELINKFDELKKDFDTNYNLCLVRHTIDTRDEFYDAENAFFDQNAPIFAAKVTEVSKNITESSYRKEISEILGEHYFNLLECS